MDDIALNLRPNPSRSVEVFGDFNDDLSSKLLSEVARLRAESSDPITVYINSFGGGIRTLDIIEGTLRSLDLDQNKCLFVTVAVGNAASAGANLLAFGNYAYAYEHSLIHFHGARSSDIPDTFEDVSQMAVELQRLNRKIAQRLAQSVVGRIMFRYQSLKPEFSREKIKKDDCPTEMMDLLRFLRRINRKLSPPARRLLASTWSGVKKASALSHKILPKAVLRMGKSSTQAAGDAKVLIEVIRHELRENKGKDWVLDDRGVNQVTSDYFVVRDYNLGEHMGLVEHLLQFFGEDFLTPAETKQFARLRDDPKKKQAFLMNHAARRLSPLWYFTVSVCRLLMQGENRLTPSDAYHLGLVDEVIGTDLIGFRSVIEDAEKEVTKKASTPKTHSTAASSGASPSTTVPPPPS